MLITNTVVRPTEIKVEISPLTNYEPPSYTMSFNAVGYPSDIHELRYVAITWNQLIDLLYKFTNEVNTIAAKEKV